MAEQSSGATQVAALTDGATYAIAAPGWETVRVVYNEQRDKLYEVKNGRRLPSGGFTIARYEGTSDADVIADRSGCACFTLSQLAPINV